MASVLTKAPKIGSGLEVSSLSVKHLDSPEISELQESVEILMETVAMLTEEVIASNDKIRKLKRQLLKMRPGDDKY